MLPLLAMLLACTGDGEPDKTDSDGDGIADAADCAPDDAAISPRAPEVCDGVDNNCDLLVDEGLPTTTAFPDSDGDGYGSDADAVEACAPPAGTIATGGDCDDHDATVFPGAEERCDGADHDCDGTADEDDAVDAVTWSVDADGDGYGGGETATACTIRAGLSGRDDDCDDADAAIHPDAGETCEADGIDQDCDGLVDGDDPDALATAAWYLDQDGDGDGAGEPVAAGSCVPPEGYALTGTDCDDEDPGFYTRAWYPDADADGYGDEASPTYSCEPLADMSVDGRDCNDADEAIHPGAADVCDDGIDSDCNDEDCFLTPVLYGADEGDLIGFLTAVGDFDGDGAADLATSWMRDADYRGAVRTYAGPIDGPVSDPVSLLSGTTSTDVFGSLLDAGDLDGDGHDDLLATGLGVRLVFPGPLPVEGLDTDAAGSWETTRSLQPSWYVDLAGDLDGDGADDLVQGEWGSLDGSVRVMPRGIPAMGTSYADAATVTVRPGGVVNALGWAQGGDQDLDGDGTADLMMVGAYDAGHPMLGYMLVFHGPLSGTLDAADADVTVDALSDDYWYFGGWAWTMPDLDGDGYAEALVANMPDLWRFDGLRPGSYDSRARTGVLENVADGYYYEAVSGEFGGDERPDLAVGSSEAGSTDNGAVWVFHGPLADTESAAAAAATWYGQREGDGFGQSVRLLPDPEGIGLDSLVVGSMWAEREPAYGGALHLISGSELP